MLINIMFTLWTPTDCRTLSFLFLWKVSKSQSCAVSKDVLMAERPELWTEMNDTAPSWPCIQLTICFVSARKMKAEEQALTTMSARQEKVLLGRTATVRTKGCADGSILPLSKHFIVWSARATRNSVVLRRLKARAVQACPVFCTRRNLPTDRSSDSGGGQILLTSLGYFVHSHTCFCQCQTRRCFHGDPLPGRSLL